MPALSNHKTIRKKAIAFVKKWGKEEQERSESQSFWNAFFEIFGLDRKDVAVFERSVKGVKDSSTKFIDLFWEGKLLVEHKTKGQSLEKAGSQAFSYYNKLKPEEKPRYILLSDFARINLIDLEMNEDTSFSIEELPDKINHFDFMSGLENYGDDNQEYELNIKAAERLGDLHDSLSDSGYSGHDLEVFLVRILFCLFAEDTGIFERHQFYNYILNFTREDGTDLDMHLSKLFQVLDKKEGTRGKNLTDELNNFPYVNGHLFTERLDTPSFSSEMRDALINCMHFDWGTISPAIFGSLFQSVMDKGARRELGAHYTSEENILRLIKPLFLDALWKEFEDIKKLSRDKKKKLSALQRKITDLQFFDPACGCGNFLIITYRELRRLELAALREQYGSNKTASLPIGIEPTIKLDHFHGIEIEEFPVRIAEVAMWLTQHQMNREFAKEFGVEPDLLPLLSAAHVVHGNSLRLDWSEVVSSKNLRYIIGNPPFRGSKLQSADQKEELNTIFKGIKNAKQLDFVACWFKKAADFIQGSNISAAFVSTNSITQGEQVAPLWQLLLEQGIHISFAHRTFSWSSEAKGKAAVHVVIVGFSTQDSPNKKIFHYEDIKGEPIVIRAQNINPYLIDAPDAVMVSRNQPLSDVPPLWFGNMPLDGGNLLLSQEEKNELLSLEPNAEKWLLKCIGAREFLNGLERWCLWLVGISPKELRAMPEVMRRVEKVKEFRLASKAASTRVHADRATQFRDVRLPKSFIIVPKVSSERRSYIPLGFFSNDTVSTDLNFMIPDAGLYEFAILESHMHMAWMRTVCGRMKSDYRYSAKLVYNNFPWPDINQKQQEKLEKAAQAVLDARANYPDSSMADLYDPDAMTAAPDLLKAHKALDKAVEQCYQKTKFKNDMERLSFLFNRYEELTKGTI